MNKNIYYNPEAFGLEVVLDVDKSSGSYEFDQFIIWQATTNGLYYWAADSGCSCPSPFEDVTLATAAQGSIKEAKNDAYAWLGAEPSYNESYWEIAKASIERVLGAK